MDYIKMRITGKGIMAYSVINNGNELFFTTEGEPIDAPSPDSIIASFKSSIIPNWGNNESQYTEISINSSGKLDGYLDKNGTLYDVDGNILTERWLKKNGWLESQGIGDWIEPGEPERLDWMDAPPAPEPTPAPEPVPQPTDAVV